MALSDIMASSIHDIKNSLSVILSNLDELIESPENQIANPRQANLLRHEVRRANRNLIQLLILYKLGNEQPTIQIAEHNLDDFLEEIIADNHAICSALGFELSYDCDPTLTGYFDWELVRGIMDSTIGNATRYAHSKILVSAVQEHEELVIRVEDDGEGFAEPLLQSFLEAQKTSREPIMSGRTRLGLYFAARIAQLHHNSDRCGFIHLSNGHYLSGACFELHLP
jgi:K+-sensing histidine kinase KdpD